MGKLILKNVKKAYENGYIAIENLNLKVEDKEFLVLVGPSGCGKSTILRMIAGLEDITEGEIYLGGQFLNNIEPKDRNIAMVFQNYALYPHKTVYDNIAFGLKMRKTPKKEIKKKIKEVSQILDIENLLNRKPAQLSGGQKQRVALGRAIVRDPDVFLMDEPLSNLDAKLRTHMRTEIIKLHSKLNSTFIYVTHDQVEAMTMGNRIGVLKDGVLQQLSDPQTIYFQPKNTFVANFIGSPRINMLITKLLEEDENIFALFNKTKIKLNNKQAKVLKEQRYIGNEVILGVRPEIVKIVDEDKGLNTLKGKVEVKEILGSENYLYIDIHDQEFIVKVDSSIDVAIGDNLNMEVENSRLNIFDMETKELIC